MGTQIVLKRQNNKISDFENTLFGVIFKALICFLFKKDNFLKQKCFILRNHILKMYSFYKLN
jgi:hypothetical protein